MPLYCLFLLNNDSELRKKLFNIMHAHQLTVRIFTSLVMSCWTPLGRGGVTSSPAHHSCRDNGVMSACMFTAMVRGCPLPPITKYQLVLVFVARFKARPRQVSCPPCPAVSLDLALRATLHPLIMYDSSCGLKSGSPRQSKSMLPTTNDDLL